jgi:hypothetical protein
MAAALRDRRQVVTRIQSDRYVYLSSETAERVGVALLAVGGAEFFRYLP